MIVQVEALERLRAANRAHLLRIRDTGFLPEAMMIALADGKSPTVVSRDAARYPLERLLDFIVEARDAGLITGITDNGAGGLSSSVG